MPKNETTPKAEETTNTTPTTTNAPDANVENNGDAANAATPTTTDANATDAKAAPKSKAKTFLCEAYPDLLIKHGSDTILFAGGKFSTDEANLIEIIEKSASYKSGQIVEA